ncbi:PDZ domain-containing protein [Chitinophaga pendula]|uniref:PDZ domain-containing protein n=1 Tax=Chitinophaga TaxID=79328 RepID=UPI000BB0BB99|nr:MULTISPECIES: PDZ domain-containing protein [Chitinophaga]ASZ10050.1 hypothetical protein CK934_03180 [Chitinophaga sp. MD30]UCJ06999.1 PDZ domain-containing protein [Chitinophaga pendula]
MSKLLQLLALAGLTSFTLSTTQAQDIKKDKLGEYDEIVIKSPSDKGGKVTVEVKDGEVLIDGKKINEYKDGNLSVFLRKVKPVDGNTHPFNQSQEGGMDLFGDNDELSPAVPVNKAMLGVITEKQEAAGVTVKEVAKGTPADKAGIKAGDVITQIDADKINEPKELYEKIGTKEPGDKVTVTYVRDKKESRTTATLEERKVVSAPRELYPRGGNDNVFRFPIPRGNGGGFRGFFNNDDTRLGLSVQDTEDNSGAQVLSIAPGSAAEKAGFKKGDIITALADSKVTSSRDVTATYRDYKDKGQLSATVKRDGKAQTLQIKVPKKLNKADL